jgi:hypothetical protein
VTAAIMTMRARETACVSHGAIAGGVDCAVRTHLYTCSSFFAALQPQHGKLWTLCWQ